MTPIIEIIILICNNNRESNRLYTGGCFLLCISFDFCTEIRLGITAYAAVFFKYRLYLFSVTKEPQ